MKRRRFENSKNPFLRKGEAAATKLLKRIEWNRYPERFPNLPPVLVNSFPKSGTHLLTQVIEGLPSNSDWGEFFVSTPSLTMREVPAARMAARIARLTPGESARGHIFWNPEVSAAVGVKRAALYFIYRDPRDVVVSEAYYLTHMNRYHRMHRVYRSLADDEVRLMYCILGGPAGLAPAVSYPDVAKRFDRYRGWLSDPHAMSIRFEDLRNDGRTETIRQVVRHYAKRAGPEAAVDVDLVTRRCEASIDPERSHTFRAGTNGGWRSAFTERHKDAFKSVAGQLLIDLGYESDTNW